MTIDELRAQVAYRCRREEEAWGAYLLAVEETRKARLALSEHPEVATIPGGGSNGSGHVPETPAWTAEDEQAAEKGVKP